MGKKNKNKNKNKPVSAKAPSVNLATEEVEFTFVSLTAGGVDKEYQGKVVGQVYKAVAIVDKKEAKRIQQAHLDFWNENKPSGAGKKPPNYDNIIFKDKDKNLCFSAETATEFEGKDGEMFKTTVGLRDGQLNSLDLDTYGKIGRGSKGAIAFKLTVNSFGSLSRFLTGVQLYEFVPYTGGGDGTSAFAKKDDAKALSSGDGGSAFTKKEKDGKKKKKKKSKK